MSADVGEAPWWRTAVVYQVYVRSFADTDADGTGDLRGIIDRLPYLARLGIDALWLTPFYVSPWADGGYDVADHRNVDPRLGTLGDFESLCTLAHARDIKVIVDIVPNHTSDRHPWFERALSGGRGSAARDRYIFRDGAPGGGPPSDWRSHFGGSAWTQVPDGQWYCHLFAPEQPDLNWADPELRRYYLDLLRFWADRGADGFRVDAAHTLVKDLDEPLASQPNLDSALPEDGSDPLYDRDELHRLYRTWRTVLDQYDPPRAAIAETWYPATGRTALYARPDELGQVFDFNLSKTPWDRDAFRDVIRETLDRHARQSDGGPTWVLSSHDIVRHASRLALPEDVAIDGWLLSGGTRPPIDPAVAERRARAATLLMLALPGSAYLYQGEELGLTEVADLPERSLTDPMWLRTGGRAKGRDGCRVPLPWTRSGPSLGFGAAPGWLPQPAGWGSCSVEAQEADDTSVLHMYRAAIELRGKWTDDGAAVAWLHEDDPGVLHLRRSTGWECVTNFGHHPVPLPAGGVALSSAPLTEASIPPEATVWLTP